MKSITKDLNKTKTELDESKVLVSQLQGKYDTLKDEKIAVDQKLTASNLRNHELEQKLNRTINGHKESMLEIEKSYADKEMKSVLENVTKVQEIESKLEKSEKQLYEYKLEHVGVSDQLRHENSTLSAKIEELTFNEIELKEKLKSTQDSYQVQVESMTSSQRQTEDSLKEKYNDTCRELDKTSERNKCLEQQLSEVSQSVKEYTTI